MKKTRKIINFMMPITSMLIIVGFFIFYKPSTTGMAVLDTNNSNLRYIDANVTLTTHSNEIVPENSIIKISLDEMSASMSVKDFIIKSGQLFEINDSKIEALNYKGPGFTGNYTYTINMTNFDINTTIEIGQHLLITEISYNDKLLYKNEKIIIIN